MRVDSAPTVHDVTCFASCGSSLFAGTVDGVWLSTDAGISWHAVNDNLPSHGIILTALAVGNGRVLAGTQYQGVWSRPLSDFGLSELREETPLGPLDVTLQCYPNPFADRTKIRLTARATSSQLAQSTLRIVDALGHEVLNVAPELLHGAGLLFDGSTLPSGVYFCQGRIGGQPVLKTLILLH